MQDAEPLRQLSLKGRGRLCRRVVAEALLLPLELLSTAALQEDRLVISLSQIWLEDEGCSPPAWVHPVKLGPVLAPGLVGVGAGGWAGPLCSPPPEGILLLFRVGDVDGRGGAFPVGQPSLWTQHPRPGLLEGA